MKDKRCRGCGFPIFGYDSRCFQCFKKEYYAEENEVAKPIALKPIQLIKYPAAPSERKNGDIWKLPDDHAPFGSHQWGYQGTAKTPYVITGYTHKRDGAVTKDGWACSCPDFCKHTPRAHCKHILRILMMQGKAPEAQAALAGASDKELEEFKAWQKSKAESKPATGEVRITTIVEGRKFR